MFDRSSVTCVSPVEYELAVIVSLILEEELGWGGLPTADQNPYQGPHARCGRHQDRTGSGSGEANNSQELDSAVLTINLTGAPMNLTLYNGDKIVCPNPTQTVNLCPGDVFVLGPKTEREGWEHEVLSSQLGVVESRVCSVWRLLTILHPFDVDGNHAILDASAEASIRVNI